MGRSRQDLRGSLLLLGALLLCGTTTAQDLYKYRGENGEWIYADRPPVDARDAEIRSRGGSGSPGSVSVTQSFGSAGLDISAANSFHAPVELALIFDSIEGVDYPPPDEDRIWVVPPRSVVTLLTLPLVEDAGAPAIDYRYVYLPGDPAAEPEQGVTYRLPYAAGTSHVVTQTYPVSETHRTRDSMYAVDFGMPVGTNVVAARAGVVFDVAGANFAGGPDEEQYADLANLVRILHDDGTFAVYAHLNWNTIRVRPGDRVAAGEYIADSGNTGYSSGPHLHFAVLRNVGMRIDSLPVTFRGAGGEGVRPSTGMRLTAYP